MTIREIARKTLESFKDRGLVFTPSEYQEEFCKIAKRYNVIVEDCNLVAKYIAKLDNKYKAIANNYNIKNLPELVSFLINYLNREDVSKEKEALEDMFRYTKRALDVIALLPIVSSQKIATKHLDFLKPHMDKEEWEKLRKEWLEFMNSFDEKLRVVKKGAAVAGINSTDAIEIIDALINKSENVDFSHLVDAIIFTLTPSYAPFMGDDVAELKRELKEDPNIILTPAFAEDLKILTKKRIRLDKEELRKKLKDIDQIAERLSIKILRVLQKTDGSSKEIKEIKNELQNWKKGEDFETIKEKLLKIAISLDKEINEFSSEIKKENESIEELKERIRFLEARVKELSEETRKDFLTDIANKKALFEDLNKYETLYQRKKENYSVVFFDIDHFKKINDTYGHEAGDTILKSLGVLFKRYIRESDTIGRYGGEEFIAILPKADKKEAFEFAKKIREIVEKTKFLYKNTRIDVTISAGVASRNEVNSKEELIKLADKRLYLAKEHGRNRVCATDKC